MIVALTELLIYTFIRQKELQAVVVCSELAANTPRPLAGQQELQVSRRLCGQAVVVHVFWWVGIWLFFSWIILQFLQVYSFYQPHL